MTENSKKKKVIKIRIMKQKKLKNEITWIKENTIRTMIAPNKKGPRKLKSWPLLAAQNVYRVRLTTTTVVRITDSRITFPVLPNIFHYFSHVYTSPVRNSYAKWHGLTCPRKSLNAFDFSDSEGLKFKQEHSTYPVLYGAGCSGFIFFS